MVSSHYRSNESSEGLLTHQQPLRGPVVNTVASEAGGHLFSPLFTGLLVNSIPGWLFPLGWRPTLSVGQFHRPLLYIWACASPGRTFPKEFTRLKMSLPLINLSSPFGCLATLLSEIKVQVHFTPLGLLCQLFIKNIPKK